MIPINGCRHCGEPERGHCQLWAEGVGWHGYTAPSEELLRSRIEIAKRAAAEAGTRRQEQQP